MVARRAATTHEIDHTADVGFEIRAASVPRLFEAAAGGVFHLLVRPARLTRPLARRGGKISRIQLSALDPAGLLVAWLRELLYRFSADHMLLTRFQVERLTERPGRALLVARVHGRPLDPRDQVLREIKAVTYHEAVVTRVGRGYLGRVIFDV